MSSSRDPEQALSPVATDHTSSQTCHMSLQSAGLLALAATEATIIGTGLGAGSEAFGTAPTFGSIASGSLLGLITSLIALNSCNLGNLSPSATLSIITAASGTGSSILAATVAMSAMGAFDTFHVVNSNMSDIYKSAIFSAAASASTLTVAAGIGYGVYKTGLFGAVNNFVQACMSNESVPEERMGLIQR